jgi:hypothetical protein
VLGIPGTPFYKPQVSRDGDKKWQGNPGEINLFTVEFRSHAGENAFPKVIDQKQLEFQAPPSTNDIFPGLLTKNYLENPG